MGLDIIRRNSKSEQTGQEKNSHDNDNEIPLFFHFETSSFLDIVEIPPSHSPVLCPLFQVLFSRQIAVPVRAVA